MKTIFVLIVLHFTVIQSHNIFIAIDFPARSSSVFLNPLMKALVERRHHLTVISNFAQREKLPNYDEILVDGVSVLGDSREVYDLEYIEKIQFKNTYLKPLAFTHISSRMCKTLFKNKDIQNLHENHRFDLVILNMFHSECLYPIVRKFEAPIIGYHSTSMVAWIPEKLGLPLSSAAVPNVYMTFGTRMSFSERVQNFVAVWGHILYNRLVMVASDKNVIEKYFGSHEANDRDDFRYNVSLFLSNTHYTVNPPTVSLPNIIEIGGVHIGKSGLVPKVI